MTGLRRVHREERLDAPGHDPAVLRTSLRHVAAVNRWLGGRRALRLALAPRLHAGYRVLDIGTGSADLPRALLEHAGRTGLAMTVVASDRHPQMLRVAAEPPRPRRLLLCAADAGALPFRDGSFDAAVLSLVLHHLADDLAVAALREAGRVAALVVVNELHRSLPNYLGARALALTLWAANPLTRHDGPLSVLRSYRAGELAGLAAAAGLQVLEVRRRWFERLVLLAAPPAAAAHNLPSPPS